jgi:hypothetical protein
MPVDAAMKRWVSRVMPQDVPRWYLGQEIDPVGNISLERLKARRDAGHTLDPDAAL